MTKKVFVIGAGFNQFLKRNFETLDYSEKLNNLIKSSTLSDKEIKKEVNSMVFIDGINERMNRATALGLNYRDVYKYIENFSAPMSKNFMKYMLIRELSAHTSNAGGIIHKLLAYIEKSFNRNVADLLKNNFDLELLFTFLEAQINDAKNDKKQYEYLDSVRFNLIIAIGSICYELNRYFFDEKDLLKKFGQIIYHTKSDIITFNYDCQIEWGIEQASGRNNISDKGAPHFNWDRCAAYGIDFTEIRHVGDGYYWNGGKGKNATKKYYEKYYNKYSDSRLIKLHGSYNWFKYSNFRRIKKLQNELKKPPLLRQLYVKGKKIQKSLENEILCLNGDWQFDVAPTPDNYRFSPSLNNVLEPIIIPPILYKENEIRNIIFQQLWNTAKNILIEAEEIILIGYSFPDTDFYSKKLFIEVFLENKNIDITIVNPDSSVEQKFRELVNFRGQINRYIDSGDYIENFQL